MKHTLMDALELELEANLLEIQKNNYPLSVTTLRTMTQSSPIRSTLLSVSISSLLQWPQCTEILPKPTLPELSGCVTPHTVALDGLVSSVTMKP